MVSLRGVWFRVNRQGRHKDDFLEGVSQMNQHGRSWKNHVSTGARLLLGLIFLASGVAWFFVTPPPQEGAIATFFDGLVASRYFLPFLKVTEIMCGVMLLSGLFVPLALVILAPIVIHIFLVHAFLAPEGIVIAVVLGLLTAQLAFFSPQYSREIRRLFAIRP